MAKEKEGGVKVYDRPDTPPSKVKGIKIVVALLLIILLAVVAYYIIV